MFVAKTANPDVKYITSWSPLDKSGVTVTASTSWSGDYDPSKLVEGQNNPWHGRGNGVNQWLKFAFSEPTHLSGFRYQAHTGWDGSSFKDYRFEKSDDGNNWVTVNSGQGPNLDCCEWEEITWDSEPKAKYFRLFMVNDWGYVVHAQSLSLERECVCVSTSTCISYPMHILAHKHAICSRVGTLV